MRKKLDPTGRELAQELIESIKKLPKNQQAAKFEELLEILKMYKETALFNPEHRLIKKYVSFLEDRENEYGITIHPCDYDEHRQMIREIDDVLVSLTDCAKEEY